MKPLRKQNSIDTAKLLAELLPENLDGFLTFLQDQTAQIVAHPQQLREQWEPIPIISFERWMGFARDVMTSFKEGGQVLAKKPGLFAGQLFSGLLSLYCRHYLDLYAQQTECPARFRAAILFLFHENR
jgi:hypothetical protein